MRIAKKIGLYVAGLFVLSLGVSFSIQAGLGVSPVSSLAYAISLTSGLAIGLTTVLANILFIIIQVILNKRIQLREFIIQLVVGFLFGLFMDITLFIVQLLPTPDNWVMQFVYLIISLYIVSAGLFGYFTSKLPLMPYDALTAVISERFQLKFGKAKVTSDILNVVVAGIIGINFIQSLGSIGIGTVIAALFIGKISGWMMRYFQETLENWINQDEKRNKTKTHTNKEATAKY